MTSEDKAKVTLELQKIIDGWMEGASEDYDLGWFGPNTTWQMATAAAQVVFAQSESQEYAAKEGYLSKEE